MRNEPTDFTTATLLSHRMEPWHRVYVYEVPEALLSRVNGQDCIYQRKEYGVHAVPVTRNPEGKAVVELWYSMGD